MTVILQYAENPQSQLQELLDPSGRLTAGQREQWDLELRPKYTDLVSGALTRVTLTPVAGMPSQYTVRVVRRFKSDRHPTLELTAIAPAAPPAPAAAPAMPRPRASRPVIEASGAVAAATVEHGWQAGLLEDLRIFIDNVRGEPVGQAGLQAVWNELQALSHGQPGALAVTLLVGYVIVAERAAREQASESRAARHAVTRCHLDALGVTEFVNRGFSEAGGELRPLSAPAGDSRCQRFRLWLESLCRSHHGPAGQAEPPSKPAAANGSTTGQAAETPIAEA